MHTARWFVAALLVILVSVVFESAFRYASMEIFGAAPKEAMKIFLRVMGGIFITAFAIGVFVASILLWVFAPSMP